MTYFCIAEKAAEMSVEVEVVDAKEVPDSPNRVKRFFRKYFCQGDKTQQKKLF
jgi:hypothetical protein